MVIEVQGTLNFYPEEKTRKHIEQGTWKRHALIETNCDTELYYAWFLQKRFNLFLNKTLRGTHVSFIADRYESTKWEEVAKKYHGKNITFYYELEPRTQGEHWWLRVYSPDAEDIREELCLSREPFHPLHLTLGYANIKNIEHSIYIMEICKRFWLVDLSPRKNLSEHEIIKFI
jgi:hypothetical protein